MLKLLGAGAICNFWNLVPKDLKKMFKSRMYVWLRFKWNFVNPEKSKYLPYENG